MRPRYGASDRKTLGDAKGGSGGTEGGAMSQRCMEVCMVVCMEEGRINSGEWKEVTRARRS